MPAHVMIIGATGGIGRALAERSAQLPGLQDLVLCAREASTDSGLRALQDRHADDFSLHLVDVDITDTGSLADMSERLSRELGDLDLVINASGLLHGDGIAPEKMLEQVGPDGLQAVFAVNAFGPILLARALLPWLKRKRRIVFASLSARVGSIEDNRLGGWYAYRAAKAAQNQLLKTLAVELRRRNPEAVVLALHPGTTDTPLSAPFQQNVAAEKLFTPAFVATRLLDILLSATPADSGRFIAWDGQAIPW